MSLPEAALGTGIENGGQKSISQQSRRFTGLSTDAAIEDRSQYHAVEGPRPIIFAR